MSYLFPTLIRIALARPTCAQLAMKIGINLWMRGLSKVDRSAAYSVVGVSFLTAMAVSKLKCHVRSHKRNDPRWQRRHADYAHCL